MNYTRIKRTAKYLFVIILSAVVFLMGLVLQPVLFGGSSTPPPESHKMVLSRIKVVNIDLYQVLTPELIKSGPYPGFGSSEWGPPLPQNPDFIISYETVESEWFLCANCGGDKSHDLYLTICGPASKNNYAVAFGRMTSHAVEIYIDGNLVITFPQSSTVGYFTFLIKT